MDKKYLEKSVRTLLWGIIAIGFIFTRIYKLDVLPAHINIDEAGSAYDAWCLANFGVDRAGNSWPLYMNNFGTGQSSMIVFLMAGLIRITGYSIWSVRIPVVVFSLINLIFGCLLGKKGFRQIPYSGEIVGLLIVFCPFFVFQSRFGLDCQLMLGCSTLFIYLLLNAIEKGGLWRYIITGIWGGLTMYSYVLSYLIIPIFLLMFFIYTIATKRFHILEWLVMGIMMLAVSFPLVWTQIINKFNLEEVHLGIFTLTKMTWYRGQEIMKPSIESIIKTLAVIFKGDSIDFSCVPGYWNLFFLTVPLAIIGLLSTIIRPLRRIVDEEDRTSGLVADTCLMWFVSFILIGSVIEPRVYRLNAVFTAIVVIAVRGLLFFYKLIKKVRLKEIVVSVVIVAYCLCGISFIRYYFTKYPVEYPVLYYFNSPMADAVSYVIDHKDLQDVTTYTSARPIFALPGSDFPPNTIDVPLDGSWPWRNFYFGSLPEIQEDANYIVANDQFEEYKEELRDHGFSEIEFADCSLFVMHNK